MMHPGQRLLLLIIALPVCSGLTLTEIQTHVEDFIPCSLFKETAQSLPNCLCYVSEEEGFKINCDHVVFPTDFPLLPFKQPITYFSGRFGGYTNIPKQALLPSHLTTLQTLDLSHNSLKRLTEKSLEGLSESLEILDLSHNLLGDQLNPIFTTGEFKRLPRLRALNLGDNGLRSIDDGVFEGVWALEELHLSTNALQQIPSLKGPNALKLLDVSLNEISELKLESSTLVILNVSSNQLTSIQGLTTLTSLRVLDASNNRLRRGEFGALQTLQELDLSANYLTQIPPLPVSLKSLKIGSNLLQLKDSKLPHNLESLDLSRNRLTEIPEHFFRGLSKLKELNLGVNFLNQAPPHLLLNLHHLQTLHLHDNNLLNLPQNLPISLEILVLDHNRISALHFDSRKELQELSIKNNLIRELLPGSFANLQNLTYLNLAGNGIAELEQVVLPLGLLECDFSTNHLKTVPRLQLPSLEILNLRNNKIEKLIPHNFVLLGSLRELNLANNKINHFHSNTFDGLVSLLELDLSGSNLPKIDLNSLQELEILNLSRSNIKDVNLQLENLKVLDLSRNSINQTPQLKNTSNLLSIDLSKNKIQSFKKFSDEDSMPLKVLDLSENEISYVYPDAFKNMENLWSLNLAGNKLGLFLREEFLRGNRELRYVNISRNGLKSISEGSNFSNMQYLRDLDLSSNVIEYIAPGSFSNSSQLQELDLSGNKLEQIEAVFHGTTTLKKLSLADNYLHSLPLPLFDRPHNVQKLFKLDISKNAFKRIPSESLQKQYFYLESLDLSQNSIKKIEQSNLNVLVNVKELDLSYNPDLDLKGFWSEPKTVRRLGLRGVGLKEVGEKLEMPFLRELDLGGNGIGRIGSVFERTTLLLKLTLDSNNILNLTNLPPTLETLDLSQNPIEQITDLPLNLKNLKLNHLHNLKKIEKVAMTNLQNLQNLEFYDLPKLGYLDIAGILQGLNHFLTKFILEIKDTILDNNLLQAGLGYRTSEVGFYGGRLRGVVGSGLLGGLTSPNIKISFLNTSIATLPSILLPLPMSSRITLDLEGSDKITNLSPSFLSQKEQREIELRGLSPVCDCNAVQLVLFLQDKSSLATCSGPPTLEGTLISSISAKDLSCDYTPHTTATTENITITSTTSTPLDDDIIWSTAKTSKKKVPTTTKPSKKQNEMVSNMDSLIFGIVGGVVILIVLFVVMIICFVKLSRSSNNEEEYYQQQNVMPPPAAPSVIYSGQNCTCSSGMKHYHGNSGSVYYGTVRSGYGGKVYPPSIMGPGYVGGGGGGGSIYQGYPPMSSLKYYYNNNELRDDEQEYNSMNMMRR